MGKPLVWAMVDGGLTLRPGTIRQTDKPPAWANPERQALLVQLFTRSEGFCVYGHKACAGRWMERKGQRCTAIGVGCDNPQQEECRFRIEPDKPRPVCDFRKWTTLIWRCAYGHDSCEAPFANHYKNVENELVRYWQADAREQARMERKRERRIETGEVGRLRGDWNETGRDVFYSEQPQSYIEALGMSGVTFTPFAKVRLPSSSVNLHVDLGDTLKKLSKHKRRKVIRHGRPLPPEVQNAIELLVRRAVRRYWDKGG